MFKDNLDSISAELEAYRRKTRAKILSQCVKQKLEVTVEKYNRDISRNSHYLSTRDSAKVLKALTKLQKKDDREALDSLAEEEGEIRYD